VDNAEAENTKKSTEKVVIGRINKGDNFHEQLNRNVLA